MELSKKIIAEYYYSHFNELKTFISKRVDYSADSEDIAQNVFLKLLQTDKMISEVSLPCLVYSVARNMIADYWRHHASVVKYENFVTVSSDRCDDTGPYSVYSSVEISEILEKGMARLSDRQRYIYRMNVVGGMRVSEISEALGENYKSVENRLGAARKEMRKYMHRMLA